MKTLNCQAPSFEEAMSLIKKVRGICRHCNKPVYEGKFMKTSFEGRIESLCLDCNYEFFPKEKI
jgi:RNase P subunit RPR2